jgi:hypothetical protein
MCTPIKLAAKGLKCIPAVSLCLYTVYVKIIFKELKDKDIRFNLNKQLAFLIITHISYLKLLKNIH